MNDNKKRAILTLLIDLVGRFIYYDRKEDENLLPGEIEKAVASGVLTIDEMAEVFKKYLKSGLE